MTQQVLIESINPAKAHILFEQAADKHAYLSGIFCQAECLNGNQRRYPLAEISKAVRSINQRIEEGVTIFGELNHPPNLQIDLNNVSHIITKMWMEGNDAYGKARLLNTPKGQIIKAILEGGGKPGVSTRGSGAVTEGVVSDYEILTIDVVAQPSAPHAYPNLVMESLQHTKIMTLAEAVCHDPKAQAYLKKELAQFFEQCFGQIIKK